MLISQRAIGDPAYLGDRDRLVEWHSRLVGALESGDPEAAAAAFAAHAAGDLDD
jgi:DNA-binding GntR family transcriptional regulator